jgi:5'-methylthioadenosine phosphorylase
MKQIELAVIGGTGVYKAEMLANIEDISVNTAYGRVDLMVGDCQDRRIAFLTRHGKGHSVPPHKINYQANIMALKKLGVKKIIATAAVGSLNAQMKPMDFVLPDQFLDFTKVRKTTFFEGEGTGVVHLDVTEPYCPTIRQHIEREAKDLGLSIHNGGCYVCTEGPRFETPAEIRMFKQLGGDLAGMTSVPEVLLAREAGMCYATICMVTNYAAGISGQPLSHQEVLDAMAQLSDNIAGLIMKSLQTLPLDAEEPCSCKHTAPEMKALLEREGIQ